MSESPLCPGARRSAAPSPSLRLPSCSPECGFTLRLSGRQIKDGPGCSTGTSPVKRQYDERRRKHTMDIIDRPLLTTVVGSYPQPEWLTDRQMLGSRLPPRVRAREIWRVPEAYLEEAQDDA